MHNSKMQELTFVFVYLQVKDTGILESVSAQERKRQEVNTCLLVHVRACVSVCGGSAGRCVPS